MRAHICVCVCVGVHRCGARGPKLTRRAAGTHDEDEAAAASGVLSQNSVGTNVVGKAVARSEVDGIYVQCWTGARRAVGRVSREHGVVCAKVVRERSRKRSERKEVFFRRV